MIKWKVTFLDILVIIQGCSRRQGEASADHWAWIWQYCPGWHHTFVFIRIIIFSNWPQAKLLIEETIRRNQSPIPRDEALASPQELSSMDTGDSRRNTLIAPDREVTSNQRPVLWSRDLYWPITRQYWGHVTCFDQSQGAAIDEYKYTVNVGEECIRITGASLDLVRWVHMYTKPVLAPLGAQGVSVRW